MLWRILHRLQTAEVHHRCDAQVESALGLDLNVDSQTCPELFEKHLSEAGNEDFTIVVIPDVGHNIGLSTPG